MREDAGLSMRTLARHAGISVSAQHDLEMGSTDTRIEVMARVAAALGGRLDLRIQPGTGPLLRDHLQVAMLQALLAVLHPRWKRGLEVAVYRPVRGVIDLVLDDAGAGTVIACEAQSELRRAELQIRWANGKADALAAARAEAGIPHPVSRLLLLRSTPATRTTVALAPDVFAAAYPSRTAEALAALTGTARWPGPAVIWCDAAGGIATIRDAPPRGVTLGR